MMDYLKLAMDCARLGDEGVPKREIGMLEKRQQRYSRRLYRWAMQFDGVTLKSGNRIVVERTECGGGAPWVSVLEAVPGGERVPLAAMFVEVMGDGEETFLVCQALTSWGEMYGIPQAATRLASFSPEKLMAQVARGLGSYLKVED